MAIKAEPNTNSRDYRLENNRTAVVHEKEAPMNTVNDKETKKLVQLHPDSVNG